MTLVSTRELMDRAAANGTGQGAFNVIHVETAEGLVAGAETAGVPLILQISENCAKYHGGLEPIAVAALAIARDASVPVAVHPTMPNPRTSPSRPWTGLWLRDVRRRALAL